MSESLLPPLLRVKSLGKSFAGRPVLSDISFQVHTAEVIGLIGRSGSGKSTLLRCLNRLEHPDTGRIWLADEEIGFQGTKRHPARAGTLARQRAAMSMVFQHFNLWPHRTVLQNVTEGPISVRGVPRDLAIAQAMAILTRIGLASKAHAYPVTLSGGQQQRVSIARALAMQPRLILFDEPTSALDPELVGEVLSVMTDLAGSGTTMLVVTHEMRFALRVCHRILFLDQGRIVDQGTPAALLQRPPDTAIRRFLASSGPMPERN
ncbi:amino acid ABC transporter ATP-binding protein [Rahnella sp. CG8]|uniref:amino acid ABC transporter ATP-binding protein n=1 Tax=Rahnella sp. CG8 TaxID=2726078 RepID=UPI0020347F29|nr:amino acid ABC transporter ATP-binding protein [Rahnella sp. CG8]MCM2448255.1 amino acid ABC transporter ATP-binding protein [Rahnella sp. CG8]